MAFQLRDELIAKVKGTHNIDSKTGKWIIANFESDENLFRNCQAMRNHIFTFWFKATSLLECLFGHIKKDNKTNLKKGRLFEVLSDLFFFFNLRLEKIAVDLKDLRSRNAFMESNPPKTHMRSDTSNQRGSVGWRWQTQVNCLAACQVVRQDGKIVTSHQRVAAEGRIRESVIVVHVTSIEKFLWKDTADNVPPTCCCPENRNGKGVCCGIMNALQNRPEFEKWFGNNWFKRELLARRHRCDLDPFLAIIERIEKPKTQTTSLIPAKQSSTQEKSCPQKLPTPASIESKIEVMLQHLRWCTPVGCFTSFVFMFVLL
jgi:hypothetical protein